jgi:hypothetical protein
MKPLYNKICQHSYISMTYIYYPRVRNQTSIPYTFAFTTINRSFREATIQLHMPGLLFYDHHY